VVELVPRLELDPAGRQARRDLALRVGRPPLEATAELAERRRRDEDGDRLGDRPPNRPRPLQLDLDQRRPAGGEDPLDLGAQRAVEVAGVLDVLEEVAPGDASLELVAVEEVVLDPVDLTGAPAPGGGRYRDLEPLETGKDALDQRALPRARRSRDDDDAGTRRYR
jgi:hypothetical protein